MCIYLSKIGLVVNMQKSMIFVWELMGYVLVYGKNWNMKGVVFYGICWFLMYIRNFDFDIKMDFGFSYGVIENI